MNCVKEARVGGGANISTPVVWQIPGPGGWDGTVWECSGEVVWGVEVGC